MEIILCPHCHKNQWTYWDQDIQQFICDKCEIPFDDKKEHWNKERSEEE